MVSKPTSWYGPMTQTDSKTKLLEATLKVVRAKGYAAARVEDVCAEAGLTKGSFFHHFKSKDDLGLAAAKFWRERADALFAAADYHLPADPRERLLAYVDFRKSLLTDDFTDFTCFAGDIVQEAYVTHPEVCEAAAAAILGHSESLEADAAAAMAACG